VVLGYLGMSIIFGVRGCVGVQNCKVRPLIPHFTLNLVINPFSLSFSYHITHFFADLRRVPLSSTFYLSYTIALLIATIVSRVIPLASNIHHRLSRSGHHNPSIRHSPLPRLLSKHTRDATPHPSTHHRMGQNEDDKA
jgi:hypothetical protein